MNMQRLSAKAVRYWRTEELLMLVAMVVIWGGLATAAHVFTWPTGLFYVFVSVLGLCVVAALAGLCTVKKRYRHWSYTYDASFFYIQEGVWTKRRIVIPFEKMQAVTLLEGVLLSSLQLAAVELQVIERKYRIPALDYAVAVQIQQELAMRTKQGDVA